MAVLEAAVTQSLTDHAWEIYYRLRSQIETPENIGKLILLDLDSGDYEVDDESSLEAVHRLQSRHPGVKLFALRIGYDVAAAFSGSMERLPE
ncbi:MAG: hypothetical protein ACRYFS_23945 [Janthinobacterium lividum]